MKSRNRNQNFLRAAMAMTQKTGNGDIHVSMNVMRWRAGLKRPKKDYTYGLKQEQLTTPAEKFAQKVRNGTNHESIYNEMLFTGEVGPFDTYCDSQDFGENSLFVGSNPMLTVAQWKEMNNDETT